MKRQRRKSIAFVVLVIALFFWGYIVLKQAERIITDTFESKIVLLSDTSPFQISYNGLDISILKQSFQLKDVLILPDSIASEDQKAQPHIAITSVVANDFKLIPLLFNQHLNISQIRLGDLEMVYRKTKKGEQIQENPSNRAKEKKHPLKKLTIATIAIHNYQIAQLSTSLLDSIATLQGESLSIKNVTLKRSPGSEQLSLHPSLLILSGSNLNGRSANTELKLTSFKFDSERKYAFMEGFQMGNPDSMRVKESRQQYNTPINCIEIPTMNCYGIASDTLWYSGKLLADSLVINKALFTIIKNIEKPWNTHKTIQLPHQLLRSSKPKIGLRKLAVRDAAVDYKEYHESKEVHIPIDQIEVNITNLGWINNTPDEEDQTMQAHLQGRLFNDFLMDMAITFPEPLERDTFRFEGATGPFYFESFNPVMVPTSNIKFESGQVSSIHFNGTGNAEKTTGELVMVYKDLTATVLKPRGQKNNKTFSWLANTFVRKDNPKKGKLKVAKMRYERVPYKGFGNYMFKTIESGLINSVYPFGKRKEYPR